MNAAMHRIVSGDNQLTRHEQLEKQVGKWVGLTFFGTLLSQARNSPFKSKLFDGGRGGEAFGSLYDQEISQRMSRSSGKKLVDGIVRKIEGRRAYANAKTPHKEPHNHVLATQ